MSTTYNKSTSGTDNLGLFSLGKDEIYHNDRELMADYFAVVEMLVKNSEPISKNRPRKLASGHMQLLSKIDSMVKASSGRGKNSYLL